MKGKAMSKVVLVIGTNVVKNTYNEVRELHSATCRDLTRLRNDSYLKNYGEFNEFETIADARADYDVDSEEMGWYFDEDVKVLPCAL